MDDEKKLYEKNLAEEHRKILHKALDLIHAKLDRLNGMTENYEIAFKLLDDYIDISMDLISKRM